MSEHILFVQGAGADAHDQWDDKLVASLKRELGGGWAIDYPRMPDEAFPKYPAWKAMLQKAFEGLKDGAVLIGHSVGGTILLHVLADRPPPFRPGALVLIAPPFIGDGGWPSDDVAARREFPLPAGMPVRLYQGSDDEIVPPAHAGLYARAMPDAVIRRLPHRDHQLNNDLSEIAHDIRVLLPA